MLIADPMYFLTGGLVVSFALQLIFFFFAYLFRTDKVTDLSYGLTFFILALAAWHQSTFQSWPLAFVVAMVMTWAVRLAGYLFIRILVMKKDDRFDGIRERFWSFFSFWLVQALAVWVIMVPVLVAAGNEQPATVSSVSYLGFGVWFAGLVIETVADWQKFIFKRNPKNKHKWLDTGIWSWARHPNYFGEMLCWWGVYLFVLPFISGWEWLAVGSPLFITGLLLFFSGIPPLEKKYDQKFKGNKAYAQYKRRTNTLVPLPVRVPFL